MVTTAKKTSKAAAPRMSDEAVKAKTGKDWAGWFKILDQGGAQKMSHQEIVALLSSKHSVGPWWQQMVTVTYEQARGLRAIHEKPGGYEISVSRTIAVPVSKVFKAWQNAKTGGRWISEPGASATGSPLVIRKATANKSLRLTWTDGKTIVGVAFLAKGTGKSQVVAQHSKLPDAKAAARLKKFWAGALDRLKELMES
ncbi:MAG: hypothetical protein QOD75_1279 [Blastocatellia bacterium]|jgi:uncharacterized protein YndB with AHSA1/START domain|nr:hypothetical protein [Blastocatellia bacterium]